jgi:hypothetical protein
MVPPAISGGAVACDDAQIMVRKVIAKVASA